MSPNLKTIKVDKREPPNTKQSIERTINYMNSPKGVQKNDPINTTVEMATLSAGDVECEDIIIERKTWQDFFASIKERDGAIPRWKGQLLKLKDAKVKGKFPLVAVHGNPMSIDKTAHKAVDTIMAQYLAAGIPIVAGLGDFDDFSWFAIRVFMFGAGDVESINVEMIKDVKTIQCSPTEAMLRAIPHVGRKTAALLAKHTIYDLTSFTIPALSLIMSGLPQTQENIERFRKKPYKLAKDIYEFFRGKQAELDVEDWETFVSEEEDEEGEEEEESTEDDGEEDFDEEEEV